MIDYKTKWAILSIDKLVPFLDFLYAQALKFFVSPFGLIIRGVYP